MSNYTDTLKRGDKIGCYQIEEVLGRGGFAVTYLATDMNLDVDVAIKEYLPREITQRDANLQVTARKPEFVEDYEVGLQNFAREAKTLARFKHPHIVRVHQVLHANNTAYMVMDFEKGQELAEILEKHETLPEDELRAILFPILDGVEEIHRHGFVHRDIKPSNIYIRENGSPVLIDFGAARYTMSETTQQLTAVVTVGYTPIEQYNVSEDTQGPWSDIYALAAVCYEAVSGDVPTDSVTRASASVTKGDDPLPSVRTMTKQQYTDDCLDAIDWGLRMEAEDRPQVIAQWRDAFDGIFNPASAYVVQKDVSIYSPHRVDKPLKTRQGQNNDRPNRSDDVVSIPLHQTESPLDTGVVSLNPDSTVTRIPTVPPRDRGPAEPSPQTTNSNHFTARDTQHDAGNNRMQAAADRSEAANDMGNRNVLRRDTPEPSNQTETLRGSQPITPENQNRQRSKLERPSDIDYEQEPRRKRTLRDEIEFDETDWDYVPPKKNSPLRLLLPALGLAAVVGGSILFVNYPDLITNLGKDGPELTTAQALELAQEKMTQSDLLFPAGESALDYYQLILASDPNNPDALAGIAAIETAVKAKISDNVEQDNLSEANRLLARANSNGLRIYGLPDARQANSPSATPETPIVQPTQDTVVTAVDTAPIEPVSPTQNTQTPVAQAEPELPEIQSTTERAPANGIDNSLSPYIADKITEIESLIEQKRFSEARALYSDNDKYIPDQIASRNLLRKIEIGESEGIVPASSNEPTAPVDTTVALVTPQAPITPTTEPAPDAVPQADRSQTSFISATGSTADHLNQLRIAIENKDMAGVTAISQGLPAGRTQFLTRMFQRYDRLDVSIDDVSTRGDAVSAKLNVSMFKLDEDGAFYSAGKWNGVALNSSRQDGIWQKIRW